MNKLADGGYDPHEMIEATESRWEAENADYTLWMFGMGLISFGIIPLVLCLLGYTPSAYAKLGDDGIEREIELQKRSGRW